MYFPSIGTTKNDVKDSNRSLQLSKIKVNEMNEDSLREEEPNNDFNTSNFLPKSICGDG